MGGGKGMSVLRRVTGMGSAGSLALALLAGGCVLAATVGPRQAQATGARALQQTMDALPPLDKTIVVSSSWSDIASTCQRCQRRHRDAFDRTDLAPADIDDVTTQLRRDFGARPAARWPRSRRTGWA